MRLLFSCYVRVLLLALVALHSLAEDSQVVSLAEDTYSGPDGYVHSQYMPKGVGVLRFVQGSSQSSCKAACEQDKACTGFKYSAGGCSLMGRKRHPSPATSKLRVMKNVPRTKVHSGSSRMQVAKAEAFLSTIRQNNNLSGITKQIKKHLNRKLVGKRNPERFEKRAYQTLKRINVLRMKLSDMQLFKKKLFPSIKRRLRKKLANLPANSPPGIQRKIQRKFIRTSRHRFKRMMRRQGKKARQKAKRAVVKDRLKYLVDKQGAEKVAGLLHKKLQDLRTLFMRKKVRLSIRDMGPPASTASKFADNLNDCPKLKQMCSRVKKIRLQCPHTCSFLKKDHKAELKKVAQAEHALNSKKREQARRIAKKIKAVKHHNHELQTKTSLMKESKRKKDAKKKLNPPSPVFKVDFSDPAAEKAQKKKERKSIAMQENAHQLYKVSTKAAREGSKELKKSKSMIAKQAKLTKKSKSGVTVMNKKGSSKLTKSNPRDTAAKAQKLSGSIKKTIAAGMTERKQAEANLMKVESMLKVAVATAKGQGKKTKKTNEGREELGEEDNKSTDALSGIVCRMRTALKLGETQHPQLLAKFEQSSMFVGKNAQLKPLLHCIRDQQKSDSDCGTLLPQLMGSLMGMLPKVQSLQKSFGSEYQHAVAENCK